MYAPDPFVSAVASFFIGAESDGAPHASTAMPLRGFPWTRRPPVTVSVFAPRLYLAFVVSDWGSAS